MDPRLFNSLMPAFNEQWAADILGMNWNRANGPDLLDDNKFVEIKFTLTNSNGGNENKYPKDWTLLEHQMEYEKDTGLIGYWGLGLYELDRPVSSIRKGPDLEQYVTKRELYLVPFEWMNQFPKSHNIGKTDKSSWDYWMRYPQMSKLPKIKKTYPVQGGLVYLTKGVFSRSFDIQTTNLLIPGVPF